MPDYIYVKPANGIKLRDVPPEGARVPANARWQTRLRRGYVVALTDYEVRALEERNAKEREGSRKPEQKDGEAKKPARKRE